jgi:hypothetical protein
MMFGSKRDTWRQLGQGGALSGRDILSVPMLSIAKIICDRVRPLAAFGHFPRGKTQPLAGTQ